MTTPDLSVGDFLYQADSELFLVVIGETENTYKFAAHGWREIDKNRLDEYVSHDSGKLHTQEDVETHIEEEADDETVEQFEALQKLFESYKSGDHDTPGSDFTLEET